MDENQTRRIEEAQLFADRRADEHDAALRELGQRLLELAKRFDRLEERYQQLVDQTPDAPTSHAETPPHSGRLPGGR